MMKIPWYSHLIARATTKKHLFWHSTDAVLACDPATSLKQSVEDGIVLEVIDCQSLPITSSADLDDQVIRAITCDVLVVLNFDALLTLHHGLVWMRQLRPAVMQLMDSGTRLIVASRRPQSDFPALDGSGLATDCIQYSPPVLDGKLFEGHLAEDRMKGILALSRGLIGPASEIISEGIELSGFRSTSAAVIFNRRITSSIIQCGPEVVSWLDKEVLVAKRRTNPYGAVPPKIISILQGAGLGKTNVLTDDFEILPGVPDDDLYELIEGAERSFLAAPDQWKDAASALFTFERSARKALINHAGDRTTLNSALAALNDKIRNNFKAEYGCAPPPLADIRNPTRLIDLSDLLDVLAEVAGSARIGGLSSAQWRKAKSDLLPLRNKIQHMRLPSVGDRDTIETYNRRLALNLS
ncbi:hypothetical protein ACIQTZ_03080 [Paenarthrobacter sp. NPDC090520]|uniref:hypothetical protein n=1 Tax=Paenarthrobacter sp. NPDC090520 TaxID=3364382 RepID=UPI00381E8B97